MFIIMDVREGNFSEITSFSQGERLMENKYHYALTAYQAISIDARKGVWVSAIFSFKP